MNAMSSRALFERFEARARARPGAPLLAIHGPGGAVLTAADLLRAAEDLAEPLSGAGPLEGRPVLVSAPGAALVAALLAVWKHGGAVVAADADLPAGELDALAAGFGPAAILTSLEAASTRLAVSGPRAGPRPPSELPEGCAVVRLTSGTTGRPRGIAVTAVQLLADTEHIVDGMQVTPDDTDVGAVPLSHAYGMDSLVMPMLLRGTPLLLVPGLLAATLADALSLERPLVFPGVPYLYDLLLRATGGPGPSLRPRGLRVCISAAAPLAPATAAAFRDRFGVPVRSFYGASEVGAIAYDASPDGDAAVSGDGCVGTALPGVTIDLRGDEKRVVVRGDAVACGYLGSAQADSEDPAAGRFEQGAFLTADTGAFVDRAGRSELRLTGRTASLVNVAGRKVSPREVETALCQVEGVRAAAVLAEPDGARGDALAAFVVADAGLTRERVIAGLRARLASHKLPRRILFVASIPATARGKRDDDALRHALDDQRQER